MHAGMEPVHIASLHLINNDIHLCTVLFVRLFSQLK